MTKRRRSTKQLEMFDDIPIPPPRQAGQWYCSRCGEPGAKPEPGMLTMDPRFATGFCDCTPGRRSRVSGYHRDRVQLVADFAWDKRKWQDKQDAEAMRKAWEKVQAGIPVKPEEAALAARFRAKIGLRADKDA